MDLSFCSFLTLLIRTRFGSPPDAKFAAHQGPGQRRRDEREWIPFWSELAPAVPSSYGARSANDKAYDAKRQGMRHRPIRREPRCDVAAGNVVNRAISHRK